MKLSALGGTRALYKLSSKINDEPIEPEHISPGQTLCLETKGYSPTPLPKKLKL